ncbi:thioesterase-like superfamily-domain-containing protein [Gongronella butleri]|nr:thioesterase-like superfamily-domain-containing protein [Gongronella butleri]
MSLVKNSAPLYQFDEATNSTFIGTTQAGSLYAGKASAEWAIGSVPNVSYVVSLLLDSVLRHFDNRHQKHPVALNCFFLGKTLAGPYVVEITELKKSRKGYCVCRAELKQYKDLDTALPRSVDEYDAQAMVTNVYGVFTMGNMHEEQGRTHYHKNKIAPSTDAMEPFQYVFMGDFINAKVNMSTFPRDGNGEPVLVRGSHGGSDEVVDGQPELSQCMGFRDERPVDVKSIPYYCDMFIAMPLLLGPKFWNDNQIWCPTMQIEVQFKRLPPQGCKEIIGHFNVPHIINNRFDLDGEIYDENGEILAVTKHQCLVVDWSRNTKL